MPASTRTDHLLPPHGLKPSLGSHSPRIALQGQERNGIIAFCTWTLFSRKAVQEEQTVREQQDG